MMIKRVFEKANLIGVGTVSVRPTPADAGGSRPRTAPGTMMGFLSQQSSAVAEAELLREKVRTLEADAPLRRLDPITIGPSKWSNRHDASFFTSDFAQLKLEIEASGGNVQPIKVRPVGRVLNGSTPAGAVDYELVYGHRRHRACLELGIPVLSLVEETDDVGLFEQMERENRGRANLSAWEQGMMYRRALDDGLYPSLRRLAEALGVDVSLVSKGVSLARLPDAVIAAFGSPIEIQFRWAAPLGEAVQKDPDGTIAKARALATQKQSAAAVFEALTGAVVHPARGSTPSLPVMWAGKRVGALVTDKQGRAVITLDHDAVSDGKRKALVKALEEFLAAENGR